MRRSRLKPPANDNRAIAPFAGALAAVAIFAGTALVVTALHPPAGLLVMAFALALWSVWSIADRALTAYGRDHDGVEHAPDDGAGSDLVARLRREGM